jgi:hypothetical protein
MRRHFRTLCTITLLASLAADQAVAQNNDDYRSAASGDWGNAATWQRYTAGTWVAAAFAPSLASGVITIRTGHSVTLSPGNLTIDQTVVDLGGTLSTGLFASLNVQDGQGIDLLINGTLLHSTNYLNGPGSIVVASGGAFSCSTGYIGSDAVLEIQSGGSASSSGTFYLGGTVNNAGTWTMLNGRLTSTGGGAQAFNNLSGGVLALNGWDDPALGLSFITVNNAGTIEQNNSPAEFTWWVATLNNSGTVNVNGGSLKQSSGTITNSGVFAFDSGSALRLSDGTFTNSAGGSLNDLPHLIVEYGTLNLNAGSTCDDLPLITQTNGTIDVEQPLTVQQYDLTQGNFTGPAEVSIPPGGVFNLTNGYVNSDGLLHLSAGATASTNGFAFLNGTINNEGTWTMQSGRTHSNGSGPNVFNNLPGGTLNLNGWDDNDMGWTFTNLNNAGTINKNNGSVQFSFWSTAFVNQAGGVFNALDGVTYFSNGSFGPCAGTFNILADATLDADIDLRFAGATIVNDGAIIAPNAVIQGPDGSALSGAGHIHYLRMNGTADLTLGSDHRVDSVLTLTAGRIVAGDHDLYLPRVASNSLVGGGASSYVLTAGTGGLKRAVNGTTHLFAVGTATSYLPVTMDFVTGPAENFTARVINAVSTAYDQPGVATGIPVTQHNLLNTWVITEETPGGNNAQLIFQWNAADEGTSFDRNACAALAYDGLAWVVVDPFAAAQGSGPFTQIGLSFDGFREFTVGDEASLALTVGIDDAPGTSPVSAFPNPMTDRLTIVSDGDPLRAFELHDATGRLVRSGTINAQRYELERNGLTPGAYVLNVRTAQRARTVRIVLD